MSGCQTEDGKREHACVGMRTMYYGLPQPCFVSAELLEREINQLFSTHWICAGPVPQKSVLGPANPCFLFELGERSVIVVPDDNGSVRAWHNVCRHRGTRIIAESCSHLKNGMIQCPYHAWTYDTSGALIGAPNMMETPGFDKSRMGLFPVRSGTWGNYVFLALSDKAGEFEQFIRPLENRLHNYAIGQLQVRSTLNYDVHANWKLIFQNYSECYHCPTVHPDLNTVTPYRNTSNDLTEGSILGGPMELADGYETVSRTGKAVGNPFPGLNSSERRQVRYYTVFPNWFVSAHPDYIMIHRLYPLEPGRTRVVCEFLVSPETTAADVEPAVEMWDTVNRQDWRVCELTQQGVSSPAYQPGPYSSLESMLVAFDSHYRAVFPLEEQIACCG
jgi:glycine betaine catabolism A